MEVGSWQKCCQKNASSGFVQHFWRRAAVCGSTWQRMASGGFEPQTHFQTPVV
jgi:hypothetical protein